MRISIFCSTNNVSLKTVLITYHSRLLLENCEQLGLPAVVREELVELLGDDGGAVLAAQLHARRLQEVRLAEAQRRLLQELQHQLDLRKESDVL